MLGPIFLASPTAPLPTSSHPGLSLLRRKISILEIANSVSHSEERDSARGLIADIAEAPFKFRPSAAFEPSCSSTLYPIFGYF